MRNYISPNLYLMFGMEKEMTPFQAWAMFKMYDSPNESFSLFELLETSVLANGRSLLTADGDANCELVAMADSCLLESPKGNYCITPDGTAWLRQTINNIKDHCMDGMIPKHLVERQDPELYRALDRHLAKMNSILVKCAIKNIFPVLDLVNHVSR